MFSPLFQIVFLTLVAFLLTGAVVRWRRTPDTHPDYRARGDVMRLLLVFLIGQGIVLARAFLPANSPGFWVCSLALLPIVIAVVYFLLRLLRIYREPNANS